MEKLDLSGLKWTLGGWEANAWRMRIGMELGNVFVPEIGPYPARVPESVQMTLFKAGLIPDWNLGVNSTQCEFIENRHWEYSVTLPAKLFKEERPVRLVCEGLDHVGTVMVDNTVVGTFEGTLIPHTFDLSEFLTPGSKHVLSIFFEGAPDEQNQIGFTSRSKHLKPRFCYRWDWVPRIVPLGVWDGIRLEMGEQPRLANVRPRADLKPDLKTGQLAVDCKFFSPSKGTVEVVGTVSRKGKKVASLSKRMRLDEGEQVKKIKFDSFGVTPWQPNCQGEQALYDLNIEVRDTTGNKIDVWDGRVGFKRVRWLPCEGAPKGALPWICEVNGQSMFLNGVNWAPIRPNYHDVKPKDYAKLLKVYQKLGVNIIRVWGGGILERDVFFRLCDELGLMVWQEFPLSSSGIDNYPPDSPEMIEKLAMVAESYIERRGGHVSKLMWCGGNELQSGPSGEKTGSYPCDESHPALKAMGDVVRKHDPGVRFLPTSAFGAEFYAHAENFGKGIHHDVHGPWNLGGANKKNTLEGWKEYFDNDDALFRAEMGCPGASSMDIIRKYHGDCEIWPPAQSNPYWRHPGSWWVEFDRFKDQLPEEGGEKGVEQYVKLSQKMQAEALSYAVKVRKSQFPKFGGCIIWMGHDVFPCTANTAIVDFDMKPKPAGTALGKIFRAKPEELK